VLPIDSCACWDSKCAVVSFFVVAGDLTLRWISPFFSVWKRRCGGGGSKKIK
jgi:hypothetical protein